MSSLQFRLRKSHASRGEFETAIEQSRKDREQSRADRQRADQANAALLAKLETMAAEAQKNSIRSLEWNPVKLKLLKGQTGQRPAVTPERPSRA